MGKRGQQLAGLVLEVKAPAAGLKGREGPAESRPGWVGLASALCWAERTQRLSREKLTETSSYCTVCVRRVPGRGLARLLGMVRTRDVGGRGGWRHESGANAWVLGCAQVTTRTCQV